MKINEPVREEAMQPSHDITSTLCHRSACVFGILSRCFLSHHVTLSITLVKFIFVSLDHETLSQNFWALCLYFLANSNVALLFLLLMSDFHHLVWPLFFCSWSLLSHWIVVPPYPLFGDVTDSCFRVFLYRSHNVWSSTAGVFLCLPVRCLLLRTPLVSFFIRTVQMVVLAMANVCFVLAPTDSPSSLSLSQQLLALSHRQLSGLHVGYTF